MPFSWKEIQTRIIVFLHEWTGAALDRSGGAESAAAAEAAAAAAKIDEAYEKERAKYGDTLLKSMIDAQDQFDKYIISLSSGAFGLTFAFIDKLIDIKHADWKVLLLIAWISWATAICSTLVSFYFSQAALEFAFNRWQARETDLKNPLDWVTRILNAISGLAFLLGVIALISFVYTNLR